MEVQKKSYLKKTMLTFQPQHQLLKLTAKVNNIQWHTDFISNISSNQHGSKEPVAVSEAVILRHKTKHQQLHKSPSAIKYITMGSNLTCYSLITQCRTYFSVLTATDHLCIHQPQLYFFYPFLLISYIIYQMQSG